MHRPPCRRECRQLNAAEQLQIYYDDTCGLCRAAARDWQQSAADASLQLHSALGPLPEGAPPREDLLASIHVRTTRGWIGGARAILAIYAQLPGGRPMAAVLRLLIALRLAEPLYRWIARHRHRLSRIRRGRRIRPGSGGDERAPAEVRPRG